MSGWKGQKKSTKMEVLRMEFSIVENLSGLQGSIFILFRGPYLNSREKSKKYSNFIIFPDFPLFPLFPHVGPLAVWVLLLESFLAVDAPCWDGSGAMNNSPSWI